MTSPTDTRLLLVEDSREDAYVIQVLLTEELPTGFDVVHVNCLSAALRQLRTSSYDTVLLDLALPDSMGLVTLSAVLAVAPDLPVIVLTGLEDEQVAMQALQHGAQDFLVKGEVDGNLLRRSVKYAIERYRLERERNELGKQLLDVVGAEQRRIGRELHDGIGQGLGGLSMMSKTLARKLAARGLGEAQYAEAISQGIHDVLIELRNVLRGLNPVDLEQTALSIALEHLCETVTDQSGVTCTFAGSDDTDVESHSMALHLYRIAQEALHNAVRHGKPSQLAVRLQQNGVGLVLEVQDNGLGFDVGQPSADGMGLRFMHHRSRLIGGVLEITSKTGEGTLVRCRCSPGESME